jgi:beta-lactamase class D
MAVRTRSLAFACIVPFVGACSLAAAAPSSTVASTKPSTSRACFILEELGGGARGGPMVRAPAEGCALRETPASTFKIVHALVALDAGVLSATEVLRYDGRPVAFESHRRDHDLASAMRDSVVWYFQEAARRLGLEREQAYLRALDYGNADPSSGLTTFWLGGSLLISADEQARFLIRLYEGSLPISRGAQRFVRQILVQPDGVIVNAAGAHPFARPWPAGTIVSAKTGNASAPGRPDVRWLVGHVRRSGPDDKSERAWVFVSSVVGEAVPPAAALDLAAAGLKSAGVW